MRWCWHKWGKWRVINVVSFSIYEQKDRTLQRQARDCEKCGLQKRKAF